MVPPHELKNKKFPVALRGYAQKEVNEYIEFLIERYTDLFRKNDELERELRSVNARLEELETKEDAINRALVNAQRLHEKIIKEAEDQAELIAEEARSNAESIISEFTEKVSAERTALHALMEQISDFKAEMTDKLQQQINALELIAPEDADPKWDRSDEKMVREIMRNVRRALEAADGKKTNEDTSRSFSETVDPFEMREYTESDESTEPSSTDGLFDDAPDLDPPKRTVKVTRAKRRPTDMKKPPKEEHTTYTDSDLEELFGTGKNTKK